LVSVTSSSNLAILLSQPTLSLRSRFSAPSIPAGPTLTPQSELHASKGGHHKASAAIFSRGHRIAPALAHPTIPYLVSPLRRGETAWQL
jgi:hypothetical protein